MSTARTGLFQVGNEQKQLNDEKELVTAVLHACRNISQFGLTFNGDREDALNVQHHLNDVLVARSFLSREKAVTLAKNIAQIYSARIGREHDQWHSVEAYIQRLTDGDVDQIILQAFDEKSTDQFKKDERLFVRMKDVCTVLGRCNAQLLVRKFLDNMPEPLGFPLRQLMLEAFGAQLLCEGILSGGIELAKDMIDMGVDVNAYYATQQVGGNNVYLYLQTPLAFTIASMMATVEALKPHQFDKTPADRDIFQRLSIQEDTGGQICDKIAQSANLIESLLAAGANVDKAGDASRLPQYHIIHSINSSPRKMAEEVIKQLNSSDVSSAIKNSVGNMLSNVISAPEQKQQESVSHARKPF